MQSIITALQQGNTKQVISTINEIAETLPDCYFTDTFDAFYITDAVIEACEINTPDLLNLSVQAMQNLQQQNFENAESIANAIYSITRQPGTIFA